MLYHLLLLLLSSLLLPVLCSKRSAGDELPGRSQKLRRYVTYSRPVDEFLSSASQGSISMFERVRADHPGYFENGNPSHIREQCLLVAIRSGQREFARMLLAGYFAAIPMTAIQKAVDINDAEMLREIIYTNLPLSTVRVVDDPNSCDLAMLAIDYRNLDLLRLLHQITPFPVDLRMIGKAAAKSRPEILRFLFTIAIEAGEHSRNLIFRSAFLSACQTKSTCSMRYALSRFDVLPDDDYFIPFCRPYVQVYRSVITGCTMEDISGMLNSNPDHRHSLFFMALKTAIGVGKTEFAGDLLQMNRHQYDFRITGLGAEVLNVAAMTGSWETVFFPRVREPLVGQWHFNAFLLERLRKGDYEDFMACYENAPDFMKSSWRFQWKAGEIDPKKLDLIEAARGGNFKAILRFAANYPKEYSVVEHAWSVIFNPVNDNFIPILLLALSRD